MRNFRVIAGLPAPISGCGQSQAPRQAQQAQATQQPEPADEATSPPTESVLSSGVTLENIDHQVRPRDDFFRFVNGQWLSDTGIPADCGAPYEIHERSEQRLRNILEEAADADAPTGSDTQIIGDFCAGYMHTGRVSGVVKNMPEFYAVPDVRGGGPPLPPRGGAGPHLVTARLR